MTSPLVPKKVGDVDGDDDGDRDGDGDGDDDGDDLVPMMIVMTHSSRKPAASNWSLAGSIFPHLCCLA